MVTVRRISTAALLAFLLILPGCTEVDNAIQDVGAVQLFVGNSWPSPIISAAPFNGRCSTRAVESVPGTGLQSSLISVSVAEFTVGGQTFDLIAGDDVCAFQNTTFGSTAAGFCATGLATGPIPEGSTGTIRLVFEAEARRLEPLNLPPSSDNELDLNPGLVDPADRMDPPDPNNPDPSIPDLIPNRIDNCPLALNREQFLDNDADTFDGVPDGCQARSPLTGITSCDSDADGVTDDADNCFYIYNPMQEDDVPSGLPWITADRVGNACPVQTARLQVGGQTSIEVNATISDIRLQERTVGFVVVDLGSLAELDCNWNQRPNGVCTLDPTSISVSFTGGGS
ncbi:hypothetical protein ABI59_18670 [Acidobacteria bacterium Mor1]|nr:hypothetical protein ABI59_18670 [Acidobacteria bacterium Mor1]